jgi:hypothetical protein
MSAENVIDSVTEAFAHEAAQVIIRSVARMERFLTDLLDARGRRLASLCRRAIESGRRSRSLPLLAGAPGARRKTRQGSSTSSSVSSLDIRNQQAFW